MLTVEELFDLVITEEGQFLLGESFITETLGFTWDRIANVFYNSLKEYARRKPVFETEVKKSQNEDGVFIMPANTLSVRAIRYDILDSYPRTLFPEFGQVSYEYDHHSQKLRTLPPMTTLRITYSREYNLDNSATIDTTEYMADYETGMLITLKVKPKKGTLIVTKNGKSMKECGIENKILDLENGQHKKITLIHLEGDLGEGYYNPNTRELEVSLPEGEYGDLVASCTPYYKYCTELDAGDYTYKKFFKAYILEALASLRAQATQADLHHIDLSSDELYARARLLKQEVYKNLRETVDFGALASL
jgi:hypothetical protein